MNMVSDEKKIELARWLLNPDHPSREATDGEAGLPVLEDRLKESGLYDIYANIELPLVEILEDMHEAGIKVYVEYLEKLGKEMAANLAGLVKKIYKLADGEFNINSPKQLGEALFDRMKISDEGTK